MSIWGKSSKSFAPAIRQPSIISSNSDMDNISSGDINFSVDAIGYFHKTIFPDNAERMEVVLRYSGRFLNVYVSKPESDHLVKEWMLIEGLEKGTFLLFKDGFVTSA